MLIFVFLTATDITPEALQTTLDTMAQQGAEIFNYYGDGVLASESAMAGDAFLVARIIFILYHAVSYIIYYITNTYIFIFYRF